MRTYKAELKMRKMFDKEAWDRNEWIESEIVENHFNMTFTFGFTMFRDSGIEAITFE